MRSEAALLFSIRQVTQLNKGKRTAGVDGFKASKPQERSQLFNTMREYNIFNHRPSPTKRAYILKGKEKKKNKLRPLGISVIRDRVYQNIAKLALEPQWEFHFEAISYGFRPKRGCHDAVAAIFNKINAKSKKKWIFEGDLRGCFYNLNHDYIMGQIKDFPAKDTIQRWLKAGFVDNGVFNRTEFGTPQGGLC
ncbi:reverse transcriptase domain-containing protein [Fictibacillus enclensis]|nr:reverse transcriptase domain-containing protein [Fictibacillus enclensis]MDM5339086.1 reverse transcriptase domain-containing protein [Fictibacillus enclensis]